MPELPEVETVRRGLEAHVVGRTIAEVAVLHPRAVRRHVAGGEDFAHRLTGARLAAACRRGKYLWLPLSWAEAPAAEALLVHLGMSGQMLVGEGAGQANHLRVQFRFADGGPALRFLDQRTFGGLVLDALTGDVPSLIAHLARDPLDPAFDAGHFLTRLLARDTEVKRALLDQTLLSGVGNIYADEALWRARLHGRYLTSALSRAQGSRLLGAVVEVLGDALRAGGTSFDALYVNVNGESGWFDRSLAAYGQEDKPCPRCGTAIVREPFMNRSSYSCPSCQPVPVIAGLRTKRA